MNSMAVSASNNAQVALPGVATSSSTTTPTNVNEREPPSAFTFTASPNW